MDVERGHRRTPHPVSPTNPPCHGTHSVELRQQGLDAAGRNVARLRSEIERVKSTDADRLKREYQRLVQVGGYGRSQGWEQGGRITACLQLPAP